MPTDYLALFRGINVGGNNRLAMKDLTRIIESLGYNNVRTYIQSGNCLYQSSQNLNRDFAGKVATAIREEFGFTPSILTLTTAELKSAIEKNPFRSAEKTPKSLHIFFLDQKPTDPDLEKLNSLKEGQEEFCLKGAFFYLFTPSGLGRSKLALRVEKLLGVHATARNWNTVTKLLEMAKSSA